jgi:two-component system nitrogen regulation response regulator GlnG
MPTLLLIDDEPSIQHAFGRVFRPPEFALHTASTATEGVELASRVKPDVVVLDVHLPDATGLDTFQRLRHIDARIPVILITGHGTSELAIEAIKEGAYEYLLKPLELAPLRELVNRACASSRLMHVPAVVSEPEAAPPGADALIGRCAGMQEVYKAIGRVAAQDVTVLILGESGTGKELIARAIYQHSTRKDKPFLAVNCAAIPETLLESELFGHEKGAFTGADRKRIGKFEQCNGGTIFLDEVGDMTPLTQTKILRVLQEQRFERVGGNETVETDVRLIAATNVDLEKASESGRFRRDLYFRLNVFTMRLPPLRDRGDDLVLLTRHYARRFAKELNKTLTDIAPEALEVLRHYPWPGNVRELQSVVKQSLLQMRGTVLLPEDLPAAVAAPVAGGREHVVVDQTGTSRPAIVEPPAGEFNWERFVHDHIAGGTENLYAESLERMEREVLVRVLRHTGGNQVQAARILGITRGSLRTKIRALGITIGRSVWSDDEQGD